jgi:two-component system sensor histidine kinase/response regulator
MKMSNENTRKFTILLVDDNTANLDVLLKALKNDNYRLLAAKSGEEAIKRAELVLPDLILLDVMMPGIDGFETCRILKEKEKVRDIPVIFMTALTETENKVKGFELGAVDYVTKPIQYEEVLLRVQNHLLIQDLKKSLQEKNRELEERNNMLDLALTKERELNKLKSRFVYMASHELRNPLSVIITISRLLGMDIAPEGKEGMEKIIKSVNYITQLLDDILLDTMAQEEDLKFNPQPMDIESFCREITGNYSLVNPEYNIVFETENIEKPLNADEKLLSHILSNIISNSIKYSPQNSEILFRVKMKDNRLSFLIKDNGIGISPEDQETLFQEFKRGTNVGKIKGSGLGLSIVKRCVELHQGEIKIESKPGQGTAISVSFFNITA